MGADPRALQDAVLLQRGGLPASPRVPPRRCVSAQHRRPRLQPPRGLRASSRETCVGPPQGCCCCRWKTLLGCDGGEQTPHRPGPAGLPRPQPARPWLPGSRQLPPRPRGAVRVPPPLPLGRSALQNLIYAKSNCISLHNLALLCPFYVFGLNCRNSAASATVLCVEVDLI